MNISLFYKISILALHLFLTLDNSQLNNAFKVSTVNIKIVRCSENSKSITGELFVNGKFIGYTLELPWKDNSFYISSIPSGEYGGFLRFDKNNTINVDFWRIELTGTTPRTVIQIHKGVSPSDIQGCIIVGNKVINNENRLENSKATFDNLKTIFPNYSPSEPIEIKVTIEYSKSQTLIKFVDQPTEYFIYNGNGIWSRKSKVLSNNISYIETFRDSQNIYLEGNHKPESDMNIKIKWKFPLFGGIAQTQVNDGEWQTAQNIIREN